MNKIKFGTSGHRGIIGESFTRDHLVAIAKAIGHYFKDQRLSPPKVLIGYDTRTGNSPNLDENSYTITLIQALLSQKIQIDFCENFSPTPVISWAVKQMNYDMGIILTASHNPPNYNGIKINDDNGAPASVEITEWIQREANQLFTKGSAEPLQKKKITINYVNYTKPFVDHLSKLLKDRLQLPFPDFSDTYVIDAKCGSSIDIWKYLTANSIGDIKWVNHQFSSDFNFELPDPTSLETINKLGELSQEKQCVSFSNDPDADRHIMVDESGEFVSPETIAVIIILYCFQTNIPIESVASTLANSTLIKLLCNELKIKLHETKIGFKYFMPFLKNAYNKNTLALGVESSGGFSMSLHTFDKCGFLPILIILGIMKKQNTTLVELKNEALSRFNTLFFVEDSVSLTIEFNHAFIKRLSANKPLLSRLFESEVNDFNLNDGLKINFKNNDWILCRPSGTEPVLRLYSESTSKETAQRYLEKVKLLIQETAID